MARSNTAIYRDKGLVTDSTGERFEFSGDITQQVNSPTMPEVNRPNLDLAIGDLPDNVNIDIDRYWQVIVVEPETDCATGDGKAYLVVPPGLNGYYITFIHAAVMTAGTTGTMDIQLHNKTNSEDILTTKLTIDTGETGSDTASADYEIDKTANEVSSYDVLRIDVDAVQTTAAKGLVLTIGLKKP